MRKGCCKHYHGSFNSDLCAAGVAFADVTPRHGEKGWGLRMPCMLCSASGKPYDDPEKGTCDKFAEPTDDELAEYQREIYVSMELFAKAGPVIREIKSQHKGQDWRGVVDCPACGVKEALHLSHSGYNGHVHGRCETDNCLAWME